MTEDTRHEDLLAAVAERLEGVWGQREVASRAGLGSATLRLLNSSAREPAGQVQALPPAGAHLAVQLDPLPTWRSVTLGRRQYNALNGATR